MVKLESDEVTDDKVPVKAAVAPPAHRARNVRATLISWKPQSRGHDSARRAGRQGGLVASPGRHTPAYSPCPANCESHRRYNFRICFSTSGFMLLKSMKKKKTGRSTKGPCSWPCSCRRRAAADAQARSSSSPAVELIEDIEVEASPDTVLKSPAAMLPDLLAPAAA